MASVFVVEDDRQIRELMVRALADAGHVVRAEAAALPSLQGIVDSAPEVVVLDLGLPDLDGGDLLRMIRAVSDVPVIVATARDDARMALHQDPELSGSRGEALRILLYLMEREVSVRLLKSG